MFILINDLLLENPNISSDEKIVISILNAFKKANALYWGSLQYLADKCGMSVDTVRDTINNLKSCGLVVERENGLFLNCDPETKEIFKILPAGYQFDEKAFSKKLDELKEQGYQEIADCDRYIQLVHPDKPGLVMLNK